MNKKELIYVTGDIDSPFFLNELAIMKDEFTDVHVIAYCEKEKDSELSKQYGFSYSYTTGNDKNIKVFFNVFGLIPFKSIVNELKRIWGLDGKKFKRVMYMLFYLWYASKVDLAIRQRSTDDTELYLYSFWLSRAAFSISVQSKNRKKRNIRCIASRAHRYDLYEEENEFNYLPFRQFISKNIDKIYFASNDGKNYWDKNNYVQSESVSKGVICHIGTIPHDYHKSVVNKEVIVIASCSYIIRRKRLDLIIRLLNSEAFSHKTVKWIHVGDGEIEEEIKDKAKELHNNIEVFFAGRMTDEEIYLQYKKEDVDYFVNMSDSEGTPVSVMEAMSLGIPCIARDVGGNAELIMDKINGFLIPKDSVDKDNLEVLAAQMVKAFDDKEIYRQLSAAAFEHWNQHFNSFVNTKWMCGDFEKIADAK